MAAELIYTNVSQPVAENENWDLTNFLGLSLSQTHMYVNKELPCKCQVTQTIQDTPR